MGRSNKKNRGRGKSKSQAKPLSKGAAADSQAPGSEASADAQPSAGKPSKSKGARPLGPAQLAAWAASLAILAVLIGFGVGTKVSPSEDAVFGGSEVRLLGADSYHHLRHARSARKDGIQRWDIATHYPQGQRSRNAAVFDSLAALGAGWVDGSLGQDDRVATALAWLPPLLAGLTIALLFAIGAWLRGRLLGLTMAAMACAYPGGMAVKMLLGFADHHALEVALVTSLMLGLAAAVRAKSARAGALASCLTGLGAVLFLLSWAGAPLLLAILALALLGAWSLAVATGRDPESLRRVAVLLFATIAAVTIGVGVISPDRLLVPGLAWVSALGAAMAAAFFAVSPKLSAWMLAGGKARRMGALAVPVAPLVLLAAATFTVPAVRWALSAAFNKAGTVAEHVGGPSLWALYGPLVVLALVGVVTAIAGLARDSRRAAEATVAMVAALVVALNLVSGDYDYLVAPAVAVLAGLAIAAVVGRAGRTDKGRRTTQPALALSAVIATFAPLALGWTQDSAATPDTVKAIALYDDAWASATTWLRENTDPISIDLDRHRGAFADDRGQGFAYPEGTYGVAVPWSFGNFVAAKARRPVTWSQGINRDLADFFTSPSEDVAIKRLCPGCKQGEEVRYVVVDALTTGPQAASLFQQAGQTLKAKRLQKRLIIAGKRLSLASYGPRFHNSLAAKLYLEDGAQLSHFRLAFETPEQRLVGYRYLVSKNSYGRIARAVSNENREQLVRLASSKLPSNTEDGFVYDASLQASIKIFRVVPGARVRGSAQPGANVIAVATITSQTTGRTFEHRLETSADERGDFELIAPYATGLSKGESTSATPYRLTISDPDRQVSIEVSESAVLNGTVVPMTIASPSTAKAQSPTALNPDSQPPIVPGRAN